MVRLKELKRLGLDSSRQGPIETGTRVQTRSPGAGQAVEVISAPSIFQPVHGVKAIIRSGYH